MPNIAKFLTSEAHLVPLLQWYIRQMGAVLKQPSQDFGYIKKLDGDIISVQTNVVCQDKAGSEHIADGYWYALSCALKQKDQNPQTINIISLINHNELHWTSSVAVIALNPQFYQSLKTALDEHYGDDALDSMTVNSLKAFISKHFFDLSIHNDFEIKGAQSIHVHHYDSHSPNNPSSRYSNQYFKTLAALVDAHAKDGIEILVQPKNCKQELGNTCGDYAVFNGVTEGILKLDVGRPAYQMDTISLRTLSEHVIPKLKVEHSDKHVASKAIQKIKALVTQARLKIDALKPAENHSRVGKAFRKR